MILLIMLLLVATMFFGIGNVLKGLFGITVLALVASALYVCGYMLIVMAVNA